MILTWLKFVSDIASHLLLKRNKEHWKSWVISLGNIWHINLSSLAWASWYLEDCLALNLHYCKSTHRCLGKLFIQDPTLNFAILWQHSLTQFPVFDILHPQLLRHLASLAIIYMTPFIPYCTRSSTLLGIVRTCRIRIEQDLKNVRFGLFG